MWEVGSCSFYMVFGDRVGGLGFLDYMGRWVVVVFLVVGGFWRRRGVVGGVCEVIWELGWYWLCVCSWLVVVVEMEEGGWDKVLLLF